MIKQGFVNGLAVALAKLEGILDVDESVGRFYQGRSYAQEGIDRQRRNLAAIVGL